jgi:hypothetical protein
MFATAAPREPEPPWIGVTCRRGGRREHGGAAIDAAAKNPGLRSRLPALLRERRQPRAFACTRADVPIFCRGGLFAAKLAASFASGCPRSRRENREGGENPPRAQRREGDRSGKACPATGSQGPGRRLDETIRSRKTGPEAFCTAVWSAAVSCSTTRGLLHEQPDAGAVRASARRCARASFRRRAR